MACDLHGFGVFSAHAEVVPCKILAPLKVSCILRARGGSSLQNLSPA